MLENSKYLVLFVAMMIFCSLPNTVDAQTSTETLKKEAGETWAAFKDYLHDQKHKAIEHGRELLEKVDDEIDALEHQAEKASGKGKEEYQETIANLKRLQADAADKLTAFDNSAADSWEDTKEDFVQAYQDLYRAYKDAMAKLK